MNCQLSILKAFVCVLTAMQPASNNATPSGIQRSEATTAALAWNIAPADQTLLNEVQHGCFLYFWNEVGSPAKLVKDRLKAPVSSSAAVGFQLSALPIGVERGWITMEQGRERALTVLNALIERDDNKRFGVYLHYPDMNTAGPSKAGFEILASTVDHALLLAGAITAGEYFGADVKARADRMVADTNWKAFAVAPGGYLCMGWKPDDAANMPGTGKFHDAKWDLAMDEERLIYFLGAGSPNPEFALGPKLYYSLKRIIRRHDGGAPLAISWGGTLFNYFFAHCWIDYRKLGIDDPRRFGSEESPVDWFENSRRAVLLHRQRCIEQAQKYKTFSTDRWGLSACIGHEGYIVPGIRPNLRDTDEWHAGTVAPYAAASAIMFAPQECVAAIRAFRDLQDPAGKPLIWKDPQTGGYGLADAFNLDQKFVCDDYVGIDEGPMLLAIENARTGLIWKLFMQSECAQRAVQRLRLDQNPERK